MVDYPMTLQEFESRFATEDACFDYLYQVRWTEGFRCPRCGHDEAWPLVDRYLWQCVSCSYQASVTAGTIFEGTRKPLTLWFRAMWWVCVQKNGASALGLQRVLGLGSYRTAWTWMHKLRRAMVCPERDRLSGHVEVDETYVGSEPQPGPRGRGALRKTLVGIAAEQDGGKIGRIRMQTLPDVSKNSLHAFVKASIEPGSTLHTDGWRGYNHLEEAGYLREITMLKYAKKPPSQVMPRVHRVASLLKRWLMGTHHGGVSIRHLDYYLDEFTFRFNRRTSKRRGLLFYRLIENSVKLQPVSYDAIVTAKSGKHGRHKI